MNYMEHKIIEGVTQVVREAVWSHNLYGPHRGPYRFCDQTATTVQITDHLCEGGYGGMWSLLNAWVGVNYL